jgi:hypothetical protein
MRSIVRKGAPLAGALLLFGGIAYADYPSTVISTNPVVYFRLEAANDTSQVNGYTSTFQPGATLLTPGAPICVTNNHAVALNGSTGYVTTSLFGGGISTGGTIAAWVNLAILPASAPTILYVAGESHFENDFDLQFTQDNFVRFYFKDSNTNVGYQPNSSTLVGQWHFVVASFNSATNTENMYWDGNPVATTSITVYPNLSGLTSKTTQFTIGESTVFVPRFFNGSIDEVAVWNYPLTASQVAAIYNAATCTGTVPTLGVWGLVILTMMLLGCATLALKPLSGRGAAAGR